MILILQDQLPLTWKLDPKNFDQVLSVVQCERKLHWHLHPADTLYKNPHTHSPWDSASTAMHKLDEAIQLGGIDINGLDLAIDLGQLLWPIDLFATCESCSAS